MEIETPGETSTRETLSRDTGIKKVIVSNSINITILYSNTLFYSVKNAELHYRPKIS